MGAPGDSTSSIGCTQSGDQGQLQSAPRSNAVLNPPVTCTNTTLATPAGQSDSDHTFIDDASGMTNFTAPVTDVLQCIALLGDKGCCFQHQLASIERALGADGSPPPSTNANFLRPEAYLGIIILTDEDDCSAPANTELYSLEVGGSNQQNIQNALGPIANYRCNQYGHLCKDPGGNLIMPPLNPPSNAMGTAAAPTLDLTDCQSNDTASGLLTPVSQFVADIKALKPDPDNQIAVAAITAPAAPYAVEWIPESGGQNTQAGELWPEVMHSCGAAGSADVNPAATQHPTDGSFGDPGVRISQFAASFKNSVIASICDPSYASAMQVIATKLGQLAAPPCITDVIQTDKNGNPNCKVIEDVEINDVTQSSTIPACATNGGQAPCWQLAPSNSATCAGQELQVDDTPQNANAQSVIFRLSCSACVSGSGQPGCP